MSFTKEENMHFLSPDDLLDRVENVPILGTDKYPQSDYCWERARDEEEVEAGEGPRPYMRPYMEWYGGTYSLANAIQLARDGWDTDMFEPMFKLAVSPTEHRTDYGLRSDIVGPGVDPNLLYSGNPEAFSVPYEYTEIGDSFEFVEVVMNGSTSCVVETNVIRERGRLALAIAYVAEMSGKPCRIVLGWSADMDSLARNFSWTVTLKEFSAWPEWNRLAFWLAHPSSLRRINFRLIEQSHPCPVRDLYGTPRNCRWKGMDRAKRIVINHGLHRGAMETPELAIEEATKILKKEGKVEL